MVQEEEDWTCCEHDETRDAAEAAVSVDAEYLIN
jgi:hypothetical protein